MAAVVAVQCRLICEGGDAKAPRISLVPVRRFYSVSYARVKQLVLVCQPAFTDLRRARVSSIFVIFDWRKPRPVVAPDRNYVSRIVQGGSILPDAGWIYVHVITPPLGRRVEVQRIGSGEVETDVWTPRGWESGLVAEKWREVESKVSGLG